MFWIRFQDLSALHLQVHVGVLICYEEQRVICSLYNGKHCAADADKNTAVYHGITIGYQYGTI